MVVPEGYVKGCSLLWSDEELVELTRLGGLPRPETGFGTRWGPEVGVLKTILCCRCRKYHASAEVDVCMVLEKPKPVSADGSSSCSIAKIPHWLVQWPELWEFLSRPSYKDGTPRAMGKITLGLNSEGIQVTLSDPSSSAYCSRQFRSLEDALSSLEEGLRSGMLTWRPSGPARGKKSR
jgi:hypothetical protein